MQNPTPNLSVTNTPYRTTLAILLSIIVTVFILRGFAPITLPAPPALLKSLFSTESRGYFLPGSEFSAFKSYPARQGPISLILDHPFQQDEDIRTLFYDAQNFLCPVILNSEPTERHGIIYTSTDTQAAVRLQETGYVPMHPLKNGKGFVLKK